MVDWLLRPRKGRDFINRLEFGAENWIQHAAEGLSYATLSAAALVELEAVMIDGWMPKRVRAELTRRTHHALHRLDLSGVEPPIVREGTVGADARALGAAAIPLAQKYLIDPAAPQG